ncbi:MAG TPA: flagellar hook basal-body protein [Humisphaera sp.]|nr:flagellar hook basal-body protein [Humisphaera sp.]
MIYGLYLSAQGLIANSYRQDVLANNLANSETTGFKRDLAFFRERPTAMQERNRPGDWSDPLQEQLGGGLLAQATMVDRSQGELEHTGNPLDMAIEGDGYFAVTSNGQTRLTRDGRMITDNNGQLILATGKGNPVLDVNGKPIILQQSGSTLVAQDGTISQDGRPVARIGVFKIADADKLQQLGGTLLGFPQSSQLQAANGLIRNEFIERANVDPTSELAGLMDTQRLLEANANMIRYQDTTLQRLVNDVGKIG